MEAETVVVVTLVERPVKIVWEKWINPLHIIRWNVPFENWHCPKVENDVKEGGSFNFRMEQKDGSKGFDHKGTYDNVIPYQQIGYILEDGRRSVIEFQQIDENTIVRERFEPEAGTDPDLQREFCQAVLDRFKQYVEAG